MFEQAQRTASAAHEAQRIGPEHMPAFPNCLVGREQLLHRYLVMRHGFALSNERGILVASIERDTQGGFGLMPRGRTDNAIAARFIADELVQPDEHLVIVHSPFIRTTQTAQDVATHLAEMRRAPVQRISAVELSERFFGSFDGREVDVWHQVFAADLKDPHSGLGGAESTHALYTRLNRLIERLESGGERTTYLLVSHCDPIQALSVLFARCNPKHYSEAPAFRNSEVRELRLG